MATSKAVLQQRKILLLGDSKTGKHCYVTRLIHNRFPHDSSSNKECDTSTTRIKIDDNTEIPVQILVIHGSQRGKTKIKKQFKNIDGYIIMFDVTAPESYDNVLGWKKDVDSVNKSHQLPCILLANKCDLEKDESMKTPMDEISAYSDLFGFCSHFETSSQDDIGIQQSIQHLLREILQHGPRSRSGTPPTPPSPTATSNVSRLPLPPREHTFKIIVIGELGTGKTALIQRYVRNAFTGHYLSTIGSDLQLKKIQYGNDIINIHIWDIAGDERFGVMTHLFYRDAAGCLIVFDVSRSTTLNGAIKWKDDFDAKVNHDPNHQIPCVLVGNKCDLMKEGLIASSAHMEEFRRTHNFTRWFEASAKDSTNIVETFSFLVDQIMDNIENNGSGRPRTFSEPIILDIHNHRATSREHSCCNT